MKDKSLTSNPNEENDAHKGAFDSNCITPGTEFMARVSECIKYFIRKKIKEDPLWRNLKIIFSGHEVPGEGEHKIMQHIREMRNQPGYQPNTRHCMYGQDADLIMLGLVSHEPHFTLLREIVDFGAGFSRNDNALKSVMKFTKQSDFQLLHLSILREYLQIEFAFGGRDGIYDLSVKEGTYDLERLIDDFVFMTFLVGNDFLPHMPSLDIGDGAFDLLFNTYKEQRPTWGDGQYLTESGCISDPERLEAFIAVIGAAENDIFEMREENEEEYTKKRRKWDKRDGKPEGLSDAQIAAAEARKQTNYQAVIESMLEKNSSDGSLVDGWQPVTDPKKKDFKGRYYFEKFTMIPTDVKEHLALRKAYIEGLLWCLAYYYRGCISWGWFYPYHYGPMLSDLTNLKHVFDNINFEIGAPLKPFEQLMGCLPPASSALVPRSYRKLMSSPDSPIIQFYPDNFEVDMNGKRNPWEGVNILPFIDVHLLKSSISKYCPDEVLTADERNRNRLGKVYLYTFDPASNDMVPSFNKDIGLPDIQKCNSRVDIFEENDSTDISFRPTLVPGTQIPYPGFPSLNVLPLVSIELIPVGLNIFGMPSKYATTMLTLKPMGTLPAANDLADHFLGKSLFINWPMMHESRVVAVSDAVCEVRKVKKKKKVRWFTPPETERWETESTTMAEQYANGARIPGSGGVNIGDIQIRFKVVPLQGMKTNPQDGSSKKLFGKEEADIPLQMALWEAPAPDPRFIERGPMTIKDRFPPKCNIILTKGKYRGCMGSVIGVVDGEKLGVKVKVVPPEPPFGLAIARSVQESYISTADAANVLKMPPGIFSRITGSVFFDPGRYDLGLNLTYKTDLCVLGYTRRKKGNRYGKNEKKQANNVWKTGDSVLVVGSRANSSSDGEKGGREKIVFEYTPKAVRLVAAYRQKFPQLFAALCKNPRERFYEAKQVFGPNGEAMLPKVRNWLNDIETAKIPRMPSTTEAMPLTAVAAVERAADVRLTVIDKQGQTKELNIRVPPAALYKEGSTAATDVLLATDNNVNPAPELGDRIANLCANGVPFGARGTVVSIHDQASGCVEVVMDNEFIGGSTLQGSCSNFRGKLCVWAHLLKISAADSKGVVDQMIPIGTGKTALENILECNNKEVFHSSAKQESSGNRIGQSNGKIIGGTDSIKEQSNISPASVRSNTPLKSPSRQRSINTSKVTPNSQNAGGRGGKQGTWREARGPDERGVGFKGAGRAAKSGLDTWRRIIASGGPERATAQGTITKENGVLPSPSASAGLKAILGVQEPGTMSSMAKENNLQPSMNATDGLKAMLGVGPKSVNPLALQPVPVPPQPPRPTTAADALMEMMMKQQRAPISTPMFAAPQSSQPTFNFTYVKEGDEPPGQQPSSQQQQLANMPYQHAGMMPASVIGVHPSSLPPSTMQSQVMPVQGMGVPAAYHTSGTVPMAMPASSGPPVVGRDKKKSASLGSTKIVPSVVMKSNK